MAIEIAPQRKIKTSLLIVIIITAILLFIGLVLLSSYFYFLIKLKKMDKEIGEKEKITLPLVNSIKEKEDKFSPISQKIDDFGSLLSSHKESVKVLEFIGKITLPKIWFQKFTFNSQTGAITLSGQTESLLMFEYQTFVLTREPLIKNLNLSGVAMDEEGMVTFSYQFNLDPKVFTP